MLGRPWAALRCDEFAQAALAQRAIALDKSVKPGAGAAVGKGEHQRVAHLRMRLKARGKAWGIVREPRSAALAIADAQDAACDPVIKPLSGRHPDAGERALSGEHAALACGERVRRVATLMLEQVTQVLIGGDSEQACAPRESERELKIGEIGATVATAQPVLLLGEIVVADAGAVQLAQRGLGRAKIGPVAVRLGEVKRQAVDP